MRRIPLRLPVLLLLAALVAGCAKPGIPDKTVVLTFDDGVRNHLTFAAPVLEELGFGATFFISARWLEDREHYLTFPEIAELHRRGFEIGDHTVTHRGFHLPQLAEILEMESEDMERIFAQFGIPKPVSFAWPGDAFGPESLEVLRRRGYHFGRRGMSPERPAAQVVVGPAFDPKRNDPLLMPIAGNAHRDWTVEHFLKVISQARDGKAVILLFHGLPDPVNPVLSTPPRMFVRYMRILKTGGYHVIAVRDLERYFDPVPLPSDPMTKTRWPKEDG